MSEDAETTQSPHTEGVSTPAVVNRLVVIGLGLIGGSLAAAVKQRGLAREVIGVARRQATCDRALELAVVDRAVTSLEGLGAELGEGDLIFIAVPTLSVRETLKQIHRHVAASVTVTDGSSVKGSVREDIRAVYGRVPEQVILGHPIAGSEKSGVDAADATLYEKHRVILTPVVGNGPAHVERVRRLWSSVGAAVIEMDVDEHDQVLACTSHLPHAIAFSLVDTLAHDSKNANIFRYAAGGFRDFTRIASSDAVMWRDIMLANRQAVLDAIDLFAANLNNLRQAVAEEDDRALLGIFTRAKAARDHFTKILEKQAYLPTMQNSNVQYRVAPGGTVTGNIRVPGDKSISHRSIMLGSLADGVTEVEGFLEGEDALATLQAFRDMGVVIDGPHQGRVTIHGVGLHGLQAPANALYVGNSGTSMRLLVGILAGQTFASELTGDESLTRRPMSRVADPLRQMGAAVGTAGEGRPPLKISGSNSLKGIDYDMPVASAQVKSCLLLAGLYASGKTTITEPAPTRDHTERMLRGFGYPVAREGSTVSVEPGGRLQGTHIDIPADISSAAFFMVAAAIAPGSDVTLNHVGINPTRVGVINILKAMGADLTMSNEREVGGEPVADIRVRYAPLKGIRIPEDQVPLGIDEFPALFVAAACAEGETRLTGAEELRVKESDRIQGMADGLSVLGVEAEPTPDGIVIQGKGGTGAIFGGGIVDSHGDHRIAMAFTVAGLRSSEAIAINNCANVATSFPGFAELAKRSGISLETIRS